MVHIMKPTESECNIDKMVFCLIQLNQNPFGTKGAKDILLAVQYAKDPALKEVDITVRILDLYDKLYSILTVTIK